MSLHADFYEKTKQVVVSFPDEYRFNPRHFFYSEHIVLQEVPDEISICFNIAGCPLNCPGCSWKNTNLWPKELTRELYENILEKNHNLATCVIFMGGEWKQKELKELLSIARKKGYRTCLYTGKDTISLEILELLDFIKMGPWLRDRGGLDKKETNQAFFKIEKQNHLFIKEK